MTTTAKDLLQQVAANNEAKKRNYKITPDGFRNQITEMDHKDLFTIAEMIETELKMRRTNAEALVEELKGGKA